MAFVFVPNADGSFTEGDRQTNTDTGIEYVYKDGAWRALGASISDQFDTLDGRYIKLEGTTILGDYYRLRGPNSAGSGQSTFQVIDEGTLKLYNLATPQDSNTAWAAPVGYVQSYVQNQIDAIPDVDLDGYATEQYVDDAIAAIPDVDLDGYATEDYVTNALTSYLPLTGGKMTGAISFTSNGSATRSFLNFDNDKKANATSEIVVQRPYNVDNGSGSRTGTGGLNLKIMANSDQNRLNILTGSGANTTTLRITGGGNGKQIHSFSSIELCGGDAARQTIWAKTGITGNLSYSGNAESNQRLTWGANKVWIKNATLDLTNHKIIQVAEPEDDTDAATKAYVDTQIAANSSEGVSVDRPPGLRFNFGNGTSAVGVSSFNYYSDNGQLKLRISLNSMDGKWHDGGKTQDFNYGSSQLFSIYGIPDDSFQDRWKIIRHGTFSRVDFHASDILVWVTNHYTNGSFTANEKYYIALAGFF